MSYAYERHDPVREAIESALIKHHLDDFAKGLKRKSLDIMAFSLEDAEEILRSSSPAVRERFMKDFRRASLAFKKEVSRRLP